MVCEFQPQTLGRTYSSAFAVPLAHIALTSLFGMGRGDFYMLNYRCAKIINILKTKQI